MIPFSDPQANEAPTNLCTVCGMPSNWQIHQIAARDTTTGWHLFTPFYPHQTPAKATGASDGATRRWHEGGAIKAPAGPPPAPTPTCTTCSGGGYLFGGDGLASWLKVCPECYVGPGTITLTQEQVMAALKRGFEDSQRVARYETDAAGEAASRLHELEAAIREYLRVLDMPTGMSPSEWRRVLGVQRARLRSLTDTPTGE